MSATEEAITPGQDTFPKLLLWNAEHRARRTAIREKDYGIWQAWTWAEYAARARAIAAGLAALGLRRGDTVAIIGDNRPELYWAVAATQMLGGIPVPLYQDSGEREMAFILDHAEARFAVVEDQEQVDKLLHVQEACPRLERIVYDDPRGLRGYQEPKLIALEALHALGRELAGRDPGLVDREIARGAGEDTAVICYTSGTTGQPKGVMLSHRNLLVTARNALALERITERDEVLAYLPMAWAGDHAFSYCQSIAAGFAVNCPESGATVLHDLREIGPTYFFAPPRIWESLLTSVLIRLEDAWGPKQALVRRCLALAQELERRRLDGRPAGAVRRLMRLCARALVLGPLRDNLGFRRVRIAYTAGEAIGADLFLFFRALGVNLKQVYGMTESSALVAIQQTGDVRLDTVGKPLPGVEIRISPAGEVQYRSPGVFQGYFKNPAATAETLVDGWVCSGDAGFLDRQGHLKIIDRARDVGRLEDGTLFPPKYLENTLKFSPYIREAVCVGPGRPYVAAMLNIDLAAVGGWAERQGLAYTSYTDLALKPEVYELLAGEVARTNASLAADDLLRGAAIRKFLLLHKELDADDEELTRTRKVRRGLIAERYAGLIAALYDGRTHAAVETRITFEDGRTALLRADLPIHAVEAAAARTAAEPTARAVEAATAREAAEPTGGSAR